jgi:hypothetical protein
MVTCTMGMVMPPMAHILQVRLPQVLDTMASHMLHSNTSIPSIISHLLQQIQRMV